MPIQKQCVILALTPLTKDIFSMLLDAGEMAQTAQPGQFVHIRCGEGLLLRRPISICDAWDGTLRIVFQVRGTGTAWLVQRKVGETLDVLGPLGNGFDLSGNGPVLLVGGGIGTAPMCFAARRLGERCQAAFGFRSKDGVILADELEQAGISVVVTTEDGSLGEAGRVDQVVQRLLRENSTLTVLACGPTPMLKAISAVTAEAGNPCQVSLEERMACGLGACLTCSCKVNGHYKRVCKDGPVFQSQEVEWDD